MRKFSANYLIRNDGGFLKNGILIVEDDGTPIEYLDTTGNLQEIAQLIFYNGILMAGFVFVKAESSLPESEVEDSLKSIVLLYSATKKQLSIQNLIELAQQIQHKFPELKIPEIAENIVKILLAEGFAKHSYPGVFLLTKIDLINLHFTAETKLKKII